MSTPFLESIRTYLATQPVNKAWVFGSYSRGEEHETARQKAMVRESLNQAFTELKNGEARTTIGRRLLKNGLNALFIAER